MKIYPAQAFLTMLIGVAFTFAHNVTLRAGDEPVITVNNVVANGTEVNALDFGRISMSTTFPNGVIFYSTDGTPPTFNSKRYIGEWNITTNTTLRAIAYSAGLDQSAEREPLLVRVIPTYSLTVDGKGGVVTLEPQGARYGAGSKVQVTVTDPPNQVFTHWSGTLFSESRTFEITMDRNHSLVANYEYVVYDPGIQVLGRGKLEQIPKRPLPGECDLGSLMAIPEEGYYFARWDPAPDPYGRQYAGSASPAVVYSMGPGQFSVSAAIFAPLAAGQHSLTVLVEGAPGVVRLNPARNFFTNGESIKLTASGVLGWCDYTSYAFTGWSGASSSREFDTELVMDGNKTITAHFAKKVRWARKGYGGTVAGMGPNGLVYVSYGTGYGYHVISPDGRLMFGANLAGGRGVSPISLDREGNFYINGLNAVRSLTAENTLRWSVARVDASFQHDFEWEPVTVGANKVFANVDYVEGGSGLLAVTKSGEVAWKGPGYHSAILDSQDTIYAWFGTNLVCLDQAGNVRWQKPGRGVRAIGGSDRLYLVAGTQLKAYNSAGDILREETLPGESSGYHPVIDAEETLYIPLKDGTVSVGSNGEIKWRVNRALGSLLLGEDGTLFGITGWFLVALDSATGALLWQQDLLASIEIDGSLGALSLGHDGTMYVGVLQGEDYAGMIALEAGTVLADAPWPKYLANARNSSKMEWPGKLRLNTRIEGGVLKVNFENNNREAELQVSSDLINWTPATTVLSGEEPSVSLQDGQRFFRAVRKPW